MNIEVTAADMKLIKVALSHYYSELADEKKHVKEQMVKHPPGGVFHKIGNFGDKLKGINNNLSSILNLENRIFPLVKA